MSRQVSSQTPIWTLTWLKAHPVRFTGIILHLLFRTLFGIFWLAAGVNKINKGWLSTDVLERIFLDRLGEMPPDSFAVMYLQEFAIPIYPVVAWTVASGELYAAAGLLLGLTTRWAAGVSFLILFNLAIGGYYDASLLPFFMLNGIFLYWSSGHWLGFDRRLNKLHPESRWFK